MDTMQHAGHAQTQLWNGPAGRAWVDAQAVLDGMFQPFEDLLVEAVRASSARCVLDIGCGTGSTTLAIARALGDAGSCVGIDVSAPMVALAERRAKHSVASARFVCADAEAFPFAPRRFDHLVSRFGVMFFADPVRAFANLQRAATADATLTCLTWRSAIENPFMTTAERAAASLLPALSARVPDAPGQFAFADAQRVRSILHASGWGDIDIAPLDMACTFPEAELAHYLGRMGPVGMALQDADAATRTRVGAALRAAFAPYVHGAQVHFTAACWRVEARADGS